MLQRRQLDREKVDEYKKDQMRGQGGGIKERVPPDAHGSSLKAALTNI